MARRRAGRNSRVNDVWAVAVLESCQLLDSPQECIREVRTRLGVEVVGSDVAGTVITKVASHILVGFPKLRC